MSGTLCGNATSDLCSALAALARKLATTTCHHVDVLTACRLITLDKKPGYRPIGIGEVIRRVVSKCIMAVVKEDVRRAVGNLQVCAGQQAEGEAAIHAMREIFSEDNCEAVLLLEAKNAFNTINRKTMFHNIEIKCPSLARYVANTYRKPSNLYMNNNSTSSVKVIKSMEGTAQGDPVAMAMYAIRLSVFQDIISYGKTKVKQVAYADDLSGAGKISDLKDWWGLVNDNGLIIGYTSKAAKSVLIVKPEYYDSAIETFSGSWVIITKDGRRQLGADIETEELKKEYVGEKVTEWVREVNILSNMAKTEPHAAYSAYTHGLQHRWNFVMRTIPDISSLLTLLENSIKTTFLPALLRYPTIEDDERALLELPPRLGGMGITFSEKLAVVENLNSLNLTRSLTEKIVAQDPHGVIDQSVVNEEREKTTRDKQQDQRNCLEHLKNILPANTVRKIHTARETGTSNWLTSLPIRGKGFSLNKQEFVDAIALRYG